MGSFRVYSLLLTKSLLQMSMPYVPCLPLTAIPNTSSNSYLYTIVLPGKSCLFPVCPLPKLPLVHELSKYAFLSYHLLPHDLLSPCGAGFSNPFPLLFSGLQALHSAPHSSQSYTLLGDPCTFLPSLPYADDPPKRNSSRKISLNKQTQVSNCILKVST